MTTKEEVNGAEVVKDGKTYWMGTEIKACAKCGKVVTAVDDCGEFGNPECPQFGIRKYMEATMRNTGHIVMFIDSDLVRVFRLAESPKSLMIRQFAHLIIPPNDIVAVKDRWSLFTADNWQLSTEDEVLTFINSMVTRNGGQNG